MVARAGRRGNLAILLGSIVAYTLLVEPLGFLLTTFALVLLMKRLGPAWRSTLLASVAGTAVTYPMFCLVVAGTAAAWRAQRHCEPRGAAMGALLDAFPQAMALVFDPFYAGRKLLATIFGLFVGAMPGLTATMAVALLIPVVFHPAGPGAGRHRDEHLDGDFCGRHSWRPVADSGHASERGLRG